MRRPSSARDVRPRRETAPRERGCVGAGRDHGLPGDIRRALKTLPAETNVVGSRCILAGLKVLKIMSATHADLPGLCGWHGTIAAFLVLGEEPWLQALRRHHHAILHRAPEAAQDKAWRETNRLLQAELRILVSET